MNRYTYDHPTATAHAQAIRYLLASRQGDTATMVATIAKAKEATTLGGDGGLERFAVAVAHYAKIAFEAAGRTGVVDPDEWLTLGLQEIEQRLYRDNPGALDGERA